MVTFTATIQQFAAQGEKTGWTYIIIPEDISQEIFPGMRRSFRVKGKLDSFAIKGVALLPVGGGGFIMPLNTVIRKGIHKKKGAMVKVQVTVDKNPLEIPPALVECLADEPRAQAAFDKLKLSHRNYYIKWIGGVKGEAAVAKRIAMVITALLKNQDFAAMMQEHKREREQRGF